MPSLRKGVLNLTSDVLKEKKKHTLAKIHFDSYGIFIFFLSACITLTVIATLIQGKKFAEVTDAKMMTIAIAVAVSTAFSVFWQFWNFGRSSTHSAAVAFHIPECCSSCGTAERDDTKLKDCPGGCNAAQYCSDKCQHDHRPIHEALCKERSTELRDELRLRDELLFQQPESAHHGDCNICFLPLPIHRKAVALQACCFKAICQGCSYANSLREREQGLDDRCPFCRKPAGKTAKEIKEMLMKRIALDDPFSLQLMGSMHSDEGEYGDAFKHWKRAADLGDADSHFNLSTMYQKGEGVEKDREREIYHLKEAAIAGHPDARYNLAVHEFNAKNDDEAVRHWIIAANLGHDKAIQSLKQCYIDRMVSKDDFAMALRAHKDAADATKSPQRDKAERFRLLMQM